MSVPSDICAHTGLVRPLPLCAQAHVRLSPLFDPASNHLDQARAQPNRSHTHERAHNGNLMSVALALAARCYDAARERYTSSINRPSRCAPAPALRHRVRRAASPLLSAVLALNSPVHAGESLHFGARVEASSAVPPAPQPVRHRRCPCASHVRTRTRFSASPSSPPTQPTRAHHARLRHRFADS